MSPKNDDFKECSEKILKVIGFVVVTSMTHGIYKEPKNMLNWAVEFSRDLGHLNSAILYLANNKRPAHRDYDRLFMDVVNMVSLIIAFSVYMEKEHPGNFDHYVKEFRRDAQ